MDQQALYKMIQEAGFKIWEFQDHPRYFGSWRATIEGHHNTFQLVSDGRESWLELQRIQEGHEPELIQGASSQAMNDLDQIHAIRAWLADLP